MVTARIATFVLAACLVLGCAASGERPGDAPLLKGWVQAAGEIRVYPRRGDLGKLYDQTCVSGVMTESRMLPRAMLNRYVAVYGTWISANDLDEMTLRGETIGAENYCGGERLFIADRIVAID
jgi:hypothetical protein